MRKLCRGCLSRSGRVGERKLQPLVHCTPASSRRNRPMPVSSFYLTLLGERATGALHQFAPLLTMTIADGAHIFRSQLREISDQTFVEKAHVLCPACGDEFL